MSQSPLLNLSLSQSIQINTEARFVPNGIVSRTLLHSPNCRLILFGIANGHELSEHTSTYRAIVQVLTGKCDFTVSGVSHIMESGHLLHMPPNAPHAVKGLEDCSILLTLIKE